MANDFSNRPGGFFNPGFRNSSMSYLIGLHAIFEISRTILSGDRNIRWTASQGGCSLGFSNVRLVNQGPGASLSWTNAIHGLTGNVLLSDGSVEELSTAGLTRLESVTVDNGVDHFLGIP